jgi:uncharacterized protein YqgV (UPF0045/DUF77 family)
MNTSIPTSVEQAVEKIADTFKEWIITIQNNPNDTFFVEANKRVTQALLTLHETAFQTGLHQADAFKNGYKQGQDSMNDCSCKEKWTFGVVHRKDKPCYWPERATDHTSGEKE